MSPTPARPLIVAKFGGTSMGNAHAIRQSAAVAHAQGAQVMVVSATSGTTNQLVELIALAERGGWAECKNALVGIKDKHSQIATQLESPAWVYTAIEKTCNELETLVKGVNLLKECSPRAQDGILSVGERLSSPLALSALQQLLGEENARGVDARDLVRTDNQHGRATPLLPLITEACRQKLGEREMLLADKRIVVTEGYIGSSLDTHTTTLGRGGSDYSAALIAEGVGADVLQIWTDVPGIASTDPRMVKEARPISEITYSEAAEMAVFGAKVLHPSTLAPALRAGMPVYVGNTFAPQGPGTWIKREVQGSPLVRALAVRKGQVLLTLTNPEMLEAHGFLVRFFEIFARHKISVDSISTSEVSVAVTLDEAQARHSGFLVDLRALGEVDMETGLSLVSVIGNRINHTAGLARDIFGELTDINVRLICQGASVHNICFLIQESSATQAVARLHKRFIERPGT